MSAAIDMQHHWLPFTNNRLFRESPQIFARAEGVRYETPDGATILDGSSGLFCTPAGHGRREIADAVHRQLLTLDYTPHFQRAAPNSFELATRLAAILPAGLDRIFFASSGSEAVDSAMKICLTYHRAKGEGQRSRFVSRNWGYHGVNLGGTSLAGMVNNRREFSGVTADVVHMRQTWREDQRYSPGQPESGAELADDLEEICRTYGAETIAGVFVEPIAGSIGTVVPPKGYLERLRAICDRHGLLLVFDEVITGFGRTGAPFAAQAFDVTPDLMTMAKALTNGAIPMSAVAVRREIQDTIFAAAGAVDRPELFHGYTYSAHPVACAAALATLDIYRDEALFERAAALSPVFLDAIFGLRNLAQVTDLRGYGMMAGIQLKPGAAPGAKGSLVQRLLFDAGLHVKATGDALIVAPAFVASEDEIAQMVAVLQQVLGRSDLD
ncbi:aminotransferase class III-fold pyridoxal phosphate-dependent enzyme [Mangrovibrevibacter kandeliae]|uniref:aminotransferase class III-fold pyridoxal phosphate-dependent enzyme n=1 Tax=Mangrovibrevibacter kandeliae TaxID=2968473 RepID=UPI0021177FF2|nr:aminotransferase class III-fold pyridoxal phosphate-dependent enzyme [Aurantimonas sp. CSK15Z-1]MCQ8784171.1 aminotransferase class III-fold pyridoxal phosphate-dependent enzyme [Aurantimonas sp. CSK15Z-1]MCQ8784268.1 aminotransferase class III-fold pyridoxal phosphate-dependent enzyme [Aurantimonas sp. CSK15Z-1]